MVVPPRRATGEIRPQVCHRCGFGDAPLLHRYGKDAASHGASFLNWGRTLANVRFRTMAAIRYHQHVLVRIPCMHSCISTFVYKRSYAHMLICCYAKTQNRINAIMLFCCIVL